MNKKLISFIACCVIVLGTLVIAYTVKALTEIGSDEVPVLYVDGDLLKSPIHPSVYQYMGGARRPFLNAQVFHSYGYDFEDVRSITAESMEKIELGNPMPPNPETSLIKFPYNPNVYSIGVLDEYDAGDTLIREVIRHIPDPKTAEVLFGTDWENKIIELPEIYYLFYVKGNALSYEYVLPDWINQKNYEVEQRYLDSDGMPYDSLTVQKCVYEDDVFYYVNDHAETNVATSPLYDANGTYVCDPERQDYLDMEGNDCGDDMNSKIDAFVCNEVIDFLQ